MKKEEQTGGRSITTDLENESVMRTKRARRCRSVLFHGFVAHKRPQFIQCQRGGSGIFWIGDYQGRAQAGKLSSFFLIQVDTVVRETPKVRVRPRMLLRSW